MFLYNNTHKNKVKKNMKYIVYKTTNQINNKFYIGVHKKNGRNYLGSGKLLKQAIKKYGRENFIRETLQEFTIEQDAYDYEKELVNEEMIKNPLCYNLVEGGGHPPTFYNENHYHWNKRGSLSHMYGRKCSEEQKEKTRNTLNGHYVSEDTIKKIVEKNSKKCFIQGNLFYSIVEASKLLSIPKTTLRRWCNDKRKPMCYMYRGV